jgi:hypothetical protein
LYERGVLKQVVDANTVWVDINKQARFVSLHELRFPSVQHPQALVPKVGSDAVIHSPTGGQAAWMYQLNGIQAIPSYTLVLPASEAGLAHLTGLMTIHNRRRQPVDSCHIHIMVGDSQHQSESGTDYYQPAPRMLKAAMMADAMPASMQAPEAVGQLYRYSLNQPVALLPQQSKGLPFIETNRLPVEQQYRYDAQQWWLASTQEGSFNLPATGNTPVQLRLSFKNTALPDASLGQPLPLGRLRVFQAEGVNHPPTKLGDITLPLTPAGEGVSLELGQVMDVLGSKRQTSYKKQLFTSAYDVSYSVTLKNHHHTPVSVEVYEHPEQSGSPRWELLQSNLPPVAASKTEPLRFKVSVPAQGNSTLTYTLRLWEK